MSQTIEQRALQMKRKQIQEKCVRLMSELVELMAWESGVTRTLKLISAKSGLPYSRTKHIYYGATDKMLACDYEQLTAALFALSVRATLRAEERIAEIKARASASRTPGATK